MTALLQDASALRSIHASARGWARVLKLPFRQQKWRGQSGQFLGAGVGSSLDFQDHRVYLPGDDPRQINWQAYARTGSYSMKLYREEVRPLVDLIFDVSASMFAFPAKEQRALELFAFGVEASLQTGATLRCFIVRGASHRLLDNDATLGGRWPDEIARLNSAGLSETPLISRIPTRAGAMRLLISDLLFPAESESFLAPLSARNGRGIVLAPFSREESDPGWDGNYEFLDAESQNLHDHRIEPALLRRYGDAYERHFDFWKAGAARHGIALARVESEHDFLRAMRMEGAGVGAVEL